MPVGNPTQPKPRSAGPTRSSRITKLAVGCLLGLSLLLAPAMSPSAGAAGSAFAPSSPFNAPIKKSPKLGKKSKQMVARVIRHKKIYANLYEYSTPIYTATSSTPRVSVSCAMEGAWGTCPFRGKQMPIPGDARPSSGTDSSFVVINPATGTSAEYWQIKQADGSWRTSWGSIHSLSGSGWGGVGSSTAAGASHLGGVIRVSEIRRGVINHALAVQSDNVCARVYRAPAIKTDGRSKRSDCIPEGARIQLSPKVKLNKIKGLTKAERAIGRALQTHGAYVVDYGGSPLSLSFERAPDARKGYPGAVYASSGLSWDYYGIKRLPLKKLRVLKAWNR